MAEPGLGVPEGAELLDRIAAFIVRFIVLPENVAPLLATWVVHTHAFAAAEYTPYVVVRSATRGCGKSHLLAVLHPLVARPLKAANVTPAALYRVVVKGAEPTLLIDEQDGIPDDDIRKILNAGFHIDEMVLRAAPGGGVDGFMVFCPKAIASIGTVSGTVSDRAIHVLMQKKLRTEEVEPFRPGDVESEAAALREEADAFADRHVTELTAARPSCPQDLDDRGCDIYAPLFAIADLAGEGWPDMVREAAVANRERRRDGWDDPNIELLRDIRDLLQGHTGSFVFSEGLVFELTNDRSLRWYDFLRGRELSQKKLSMMLASFGIHPDRKQIDGRQLRGYHLRDLEQAFERYLDAPEPPPPTDDEDAVPLRDRLGVADAFMTTRKREEKKKLTDEANPFLRDKDDGKLTD